MDAMRQSALAPVREKFVRVLRRKIPQVVARYSDAELNSYCDKGISSAAQWAMQTEYNAYVVVAAMIVLGDKFANASSSAWRARVLESDHLHENSKAKLLELRVYVETGTDIAPNGR
jgi:hypothetical protein